MPNASVYDKNDIYFNVRNFLGSAESDGLYVATLAVNATETNGGTKEMDACPHVKEIKNVKPSANGCEECLKSGDSWVHLRLCLICGHVGCCDSSKNKHATKHFHRTKHPIVQSLEPGEDWRWCYVDELMLD